ncbi:MAG: large conductance mechanosensitive channel protein MscL [Sporichthyaceae bacterium]
MLKGFKDFLLRGNIVDLAVAVVIGTAFTMLVTAFTKSMIEPVINFALGGGVDGGSIGLDKENRLEFGMFLNAVITFVITAAVVYFLVVIPMKKVTARMKRVSDTESAAPQIPADVALLTEIRDLLANQGNAKTF